MGSCTQSLILAQKGTCGKVPCDCGEVTARETDMETHPAHAMSGAPALTAGFVPSKSCFTPQNQTFGAFKGLFKGAPGE